MNTQYTVGLYHNAELKKFTIFYNKQKQACSSPGELLPHPSTWLASTANGPEKEQSGLCILGAAGNVQHTLGPSGMPRPLAECLSQHTDIKSDTRSPKQ